MLPFLQLLAAFLNIFLLIILQPYFVTRAALGYYPPVSLVQDLKDALLKVSTVNRNKSNFDLPGN